MSSSSYCNQFHIKDKICTTISSKTFTKNVIKKGKGQGQRSTNLWKFSSTSHADELENVVETPRIRLPLLDDGVQLRQVIAEDGTLHDTLSCMHQVDIATQGVYLAIVSYKPTQQYSH